MWGKRGKMYSLAPASAQKNTQEVSLGCSVHACECTQTFKVNPINICICTETCMLSPHMNMYPFTLDGEYTWMVHTFLQRAAPVTDVHKACCQEESPFIFPFYSLHILACLSLCAVWPCHQSRFFSLFSFFSLFLLPLYRHEVELICARRD